MTETPVNRACPHCSMPLTDGASRCSFREGTLQRQPHLLLSSLLWVVKAYRLWSLGVFAYALSRLAMVGKVESYYVLFLVIFPFGMALAISYRLGDATSRWIVAFLILVDVGVILAPEHRLLPKLNLFPDLPLTQSRILTWYLLIYAWLQFVVLPPVVFSRSLRTARRGGQPALASWICLLGFAVWGLIVTVVVLLASKG
jgi:hypothetical protein